MSYSPKPCMTLSGTQKKTLSRTDAVLFYNESKWWSFDVWTLIKLGCLFSRNVIIIIGALYTAVWSVVLTKLHKMMCFASSSGDLLTDKWGYLDEGRKEKEAAFKSTFEVHMHELGSCHFDSRCIQITLVKARCKKQDIPFLVSFIVSRINK